MLDIEKDLLKNNYTFIAGIDEAGRGPLAGPVVVASVIMPLDDDKIISGVNDSKKLTEKKRNELFDKVINTAISYNIEFVDVKTIDEINILNATKLGMKKCVENLSVLPDIVLIDAVPLDLMVESKSIIHGDALSYSIACASILAKVTRDKFMVELHKKYPEYNFEKHKGYGTKEHIENLKKFGPCVEHRKTFIKNFIN